LSDSVAATAGEERVLASHPVERRSELVQVLMVPYRVVSMVTKCRAVVFLTENSSWERC